MKAVIKSTEKRDCIIWPYAKSLGYGLINRNIAPSALAHRAVCIMAHGEPPFEKAQAAHSCGNGRNGCVNPNHLRWATALENAQDRKNSGDPRIGKTVLSLSEVSEIRRLLKDGERLCDLAARYDVSPACIADIRLGRTWKRNPQL